MVIGPDEGPEPRLVQHGQLRRQADQRIDEEYLLEFLRPIAAGDQQMPDLMLGIEQHHADGVERIRFAQSVDHGVQQLRQAVGAQQRQFARLRALHDGLVVGRLRGHFLEALLELFVLPSQLIHVRHPLNLQPARAAARTSK